MTRRAVRLHWTVGLAAAVAAFFGWLALEASGACDTSCPSDRAIAIYKVMKYAGTTIAVLVLFSALARKPADPPDQRG